MGFAYGEGGCDFSTVEAGEEGFFHPFGAILGNGRNRTIFAGMSIGNRRGETVRVHSLGLASEQRGKDRGRVPQLIQDNQLGISNRLVLRPERACFNKPNLVELNSEKRQYQYFIVESKQRRSEPTIFQSSLLIPHGSSGIPGKSGACHGGPTITLYVTFSVHQLFQCVKARQERTGTTPTPRPFQSTPSARLCLVLSKRPRNLCFRSRGWMRGRSACVRGAFCASRCSL